MRILMVSWEYPPVIVGGLGRHVHHLATHLAAQGHDVVVLSRHPSGTDAHSHPTVDRTAEGVRVVAVAEDPPHFVFGEDMMAWTLAMGHAMVRAGLALGAGLLDGPRAGAPWTPQIVHAHDWLVAHPAIALAEDFRVPLVSTIHATEAGRHAGWVSSNMNRQVHSVEWWLANASDSLITCSESMHDEVTTLFGPDLPEITTIRNGINLQTWSFRPRCRSAASEGPPRLLYVGRLEYEKGVQDAIAALPAIHDEHPGTTLTIAGEGTQRQWLADCAAEHDVADAVRFLGRLDHAELLEQLHAADAAVLPSRYEPFGIVALEAAATGTPLVASTAGGLGEAVVDGRTGYSFAPSDPDDLAKAVCRSLEDPERTQDLARTAHVRLTTEFTWEHVAAQTSDVYAAAAWHAPKPLGRPVIVARPLPDR
ncbi:glycosyltransferase family 4 protein [Tomitella cavernea]|uniref:glycosyltransferase family 4 protein n=1 Tax=Tomitella cavernea TaxID=1387982 RepID=UPI00190605D6|nr:glycosyltransferase family 4 protein [Tomitella cavernea]